METTALEPRGETDSVATDIGTIAEIDLRVGRGHVELVENHESYVQSLGEAVLSSSRRQEVRAQLKCVLKEASRALDVRKMTGEDRFRS